MYEPLISLGDLIRNWIAALRINRNGFIEIVVAAIGLSLLAFGFSVFIGLTAPERGIAIALALILGLPYLIVSLLFNLAAHEMTQASLLGRAMPLREALGNGLHKLISALGMVIMQCVVSLATMVPFAVMYWIIGKVSNSSGLENIGRGGSVAISMLTALVIVAMLVAVVLVGIKIRFAVAALIADHKPAMAAIKSSWQMTSGRLWSVTWRMLVFGIVTGVPLAIINVALSRLGGITAFMQQNNLPLSLGQSLWSSVVDGLTVTVGMLAQAGFTMSIWKDLTRVRQ